MKKIPTIFERDWNGDKSLVLDKPHPDCAWVFAGEGVATVKLDGSCCLVRGGKLFKRREVKSGGYIPDDMEIIDTDQETGARVGWVPVGAGSEDQWHREAFGNPEAFPDGTYELLGPKVQGNLENSAGHLLVRHGTLSPGEVPRDFEGLKAWLAERQSDREGLVFHHPDGRMAKIKLRDFGITRKKLGA